MRYVEWIVMFVVAGLGIALANFVGFQVSFMDSLPGIAILLLISLAAVVVTGRHHFHRLRDSHFHRPRSRLGLWLQQ